VRSLMETVHAVLAVSVRQKVVTLGVNVSIVNVVRKRRRARNATIQIVSVALTASVRPAPVRRARRRQTEWRL